MKSSEHLTVCPECQRAYTFPIDTPPKKIKDFVVTEPIARGFYGATYKVKNIRTGAKFIIKVIPKVTYSKDMGYNKNFWKEVRNHRNVSNHNDYVPRLIDAGETKIKFGKVVIECYYIQMDPIEGLTLRQFKKSDKITANRIAQIAYDLLDFFRQMNVDQVHHNDLHDGNIIVEITDGEHGRLNAIDRSVMAHVVDIGSMSRIDRSGGNNFRDTTWIVNHVQEMIDIYWQKAADSTHTSEHRVLGMLNGLVSTIAGKERARENEIEGYCEEIYNIVKRSDMPWQEPRVLLTLSQFYNAQPMPSYFAPHLFYDPEEKWTRSIISPGPVLLTGMRGCGKTILLKSLHFLARAEKCDGENQEAVVKRLNEDNYIGLFVSASTLLTDPKSVELHLPTQRLILAYSLDLIRCLKFSELEKIGRINYNETSHLCQTIHDLIPWFKEPSNTHDLEAIEIRIEDALLKTRTIPPSKAGSLNVYEAFNTLAERTVNSNDLWRRKRVIYLLDDLSTRYLKQKNVDEILSQFCFQAESFSFKISTETPSLHLKTGAGQISWLDRDYKEFDLGSDVIQVLKNPETEFIEEVLQRRLKLVQDYENVSPINLLGTQSLINLAKSLSQNSSRSRRRSYWGIKALGALSTGDVGDSIAMFDHMLKKVNKKSILEQKPIPEKKQASVIFDFSERKLRSLANQEKWFYDHAVSFAQASQMEMRSSYRASVRSGKGRIRQYGEVFLHIDPAEAEDIFKRINRLVEGGVFVFAGATPRAKQTSLNSPLFIKLAFKKILGVTNLMPLSYGDRFELSGKMVNDWLTHPTADKLRRSVGKGNGDSDYFNETQWDWNDVNEGLEEVVPGLPMVPTKNDNSGLQIKLDHLDDLDRLEKYKKQRKPLKYTPRIPLDVESFSLRKLYRNDIEGKHIIGAIGFEERSVGTWTNILVVGKPAEITMIEYKNDESTRIDELHRKNKEAILGILKDSGIPFNTVKYEFFIDKTGSSMFDNQRIMEWTEKSSSKDYVLDITSLSKPLIYLFVSEVLKLRRKIGILHTSAAEYLPTSSKIEKTLGLLKKNVPQFFSEADKLVEGELEPQSKVTVRQNRNPGAAVYLVCFMSLKYKRVKKLLEELPVEAVDIIYPLSSDGIKSPRSKFATKIANILVDDSGKAWPTGSDDHIGAYKKLRSLYSSHYLDSGINFEVGLTGTKMHTVAAGMLGSIINFSGVYYTPVAFEPTKYTAGTGNSTFTELKMVTKKL
jgi:serine/threonine protein kinase